MDGCILAKITTKRLVASGDLTGRYLYGWVQQVPSIRESAAGDATAPYRGTVTSDTVWFNPLVEINNLELSVDDQVWVRPRGYTAGQLFYETVASLGGNVRGPASTTDNAIVRWDGTTGKVIQNSIASIDDSGYVLATGYQCTGNPYNFQDDGGSTYLAFAGPGAYTQYLADGQLALGQLRANDYVSAASYRTGTGGLSVGGSTTTGGITFENGLYISGSFSGGSGTVTSVSATAPAAGFTVSGSPVTTSGGFTFTLSDDLAGLEAMSGTGIVVRTASNTYAQRTLTAPAAGITVSNGDGVSGNPTLALANDLAALEALSGTNTIYYRSGTSTWTGVTVGTGLSFSGGTLSSTVTGTVTSVNLTAPAAGITVSGGPITSSGSITLALADDLAALEALSGTNTIYYRSGTSTWSAVTIGSGLDFTSGTLSAPAGSGITQLSGDVTAGPGSGAQTATIANDAVTFAKMQNVATLSLLYRRSVGTGDIEAQTVSPMVDTILTASTGDVVRGAIGNPYYILLRDEKGATTEGGSNTGGSYQTRTLNTEVSDAGNHCSLSSNQFTLTAGTYRIRARVPGYRCGRHQARLRNVTDGTTVIVGTPAYSENASNVQGWCWIEGRFTVAASKALEIQHYTTTSVTSQGWGLYGDGTSTSVYTVVELWKED